MQLSKKVVFGIVLVCLMLGTALGVVLTQWQVEMQVQISGAELKLFEPDGITEVSFVDFGTMSKGESKRKPDVMTESYFLKNVGEEDCYVYSWTSEFTEGTLEFLGPTNGTLVAGGSELGAALRLTINSDATRGIYSITLFIEGRDA